MWCVLFDPSHFVVIIGSQKYHHQRAQWTTLILNTKAYKLALKLLFMCTITLLHAHDLSILLWPSIINIPPFHFMAAGCDSLQKEPCKRFKNNLLTNPKPPFMTIVFRWSILDCYKENVLFPKNHNETTCSCNLSLWLTINIIYTTVVLWFCKLSTWDNIKQHNIFQMMVATRNLLIILTLSLVLVTISLFTLISQISRWVVGWVANSNVAILSILWRRKNKNVWWAFQGWSQSCLESPL